MYSTGYHAAGYYDTGYYLASNDLGGYPRGGKAGGEDKDKNKNKNKKKRIVHVVKRPVFDEGAIPEGISDVTKEVLAVGKAEVNGVEVEVVNIPTPPISTISAAAPSLESIQLEIDRELAELIRAQEARAYAQLLLKYQVEVRKFEEDFLMLLILIMDE